MTPAYDERYLSDAMCNLGEAFDFARHVGQVGLDDFLAMMIATGAAAQFARGAPKYVSGTSGTELALNVMQKSGVPVVNAAAQTEYDCSPEYWAGWIIAYFQWRTGRSFPSIHEALSMREVISLYPALHEASEDRAVDGLNHAIRAKRLPARLQTRRKNCALSQTELSRASGVALPNIQQYEQRAQDINQAPGGVLRALARALSCEIEDLLEYDCEEAAVDTPTA